MNGKLTPFVVSTSASIVEALELIDKNKKGFLIVVRERSEVIGTLTDGDIRRAFISGVSIDETVAKIYKRDFTSLLYKDGLSYAIDLFKNRAIKFLPIVNKENKLINILTKSQLHSLLLQDIHADLKYDFTSLDESIVDYEIFQRPWGFYKTTVYNEYFQSKVISVKPGAQLSLQSHDHREEYWIVVHGTGTVQLDQSVLDVRCGSSVFVPIGCKHRLSNTDPRESLIITEVQIGEHLGEDDIIRYEDIYGRV